MPIIQSMIRRRSVRRFTDKEVSREILMTCLQAAHLSPSAENSQPWRYIILDDPDLKTRFGETVFTGVFSATRWALKAPVLVAICADLDILANRMGKMFTGIPFYMLDVGMSGEHFALQAAEMGLGTCWIGWFNARRARKALNIPRKYKPVCLLSLGYYEKKPAKEKKRRTLEEIVWFNSF